MLPFVVAENVLKSSKLKLEGATLDVRPKLTVLSHRQSTQITNTSEKWHQLKTNERDSDQFPNRQLGILSGQDIDQEWSRGVFPMEVSDNGGWYSVCSKLLLHA